MAFNLALSQPCNKSNLSPSNGIKPKYVLEKSMSPGCKPDDSSVDNRYQKLPNF